MSRFTETLTMSQMSGTSEAWRLWKMHEALVFERGEKGSGRLIVVPVNFVSDGPTIPQLFWNVMPVWGTYGRAGVIHDYLCARIELGKPHREAKTRKDADNILYEAMLVLGVGFIPRWLLYFGVTIGRWLGVRPHMIDYNRELLKAEVEE